MEEIESEKDDSGVGIWRTLDASANRSAEAVRVLEDILRFCLDDAFLSQEAKAIRHELAIIFSREDLQARIRLRDVLGDVGVSSSISLSPTVKNRTLTIWSGISSGGCDFNPSSSKNFAVSLKSERATPIWSIFMVIILFQYPEEANLSSPLFVLSNSWTSSISKASCLAIII